MLYTHDWKSLGKTRIRRWTNHPTRTEQVKTQLEDPRPVKVSIDSWVGMSVGAKHYNLTIEEEGNQWWSPKENDWVEISCDSHKNGFNMRAACYSQEEAEELAKETLNIIFGKPRSKKRKLWKIEKDY